MDRWLSSFLNFTLLHWETKNLHRFNSASRHFSGPHIFRQQPWGAVQLYGTWLWAGLQHEQEHVGGCGLQPRAGQKAGETDGGEWRLSPCGGVIGQERDAFKRQEKQNTKHFYFLCVKGALWYQIMPRPHSFLKFKKRTSIHWNNIKDWGAASLKPVRSFITFSLPFIHWPAGGVSLHAILKWLSTLDTMSK